VVLVACPSIIAEVNTEKAEVKFRQNAMRIPGIIRGKITLQKVWDLDAPNILEARSRLGWIPLV